MAETNDNQQNIDQSHSGSGDNVAGDSNRNQSGVVGNDDTTINIGTVIQNPAPKLPERTGVEPPNNLGDRGIRKAAQFVGREEAIADLHEKLQRSERVAIAGVAGMGGVGKTELAVQYGRRFLRSEYGGGVVWLSGAQGFTDLLSFAQGVLFPDQKLAEMGDEAAIVQFIWNHWPSASVSPLGKGGLRGDPSESTPATNSDVEAGDGMAPPSVPPYEREEENGRVLVIFDDVTDYGAQVVPVLPTNNDPRFRVVVTTRQRLEGIERLDLNVLLPGDAIALLGAIAGKERVAAERETAAAICEWLGFLPLAVELVGYFLKKKAGLSLAEMLSRLQGKRAESKALNPKRLPVGLTARRGVLDAFELSWQELGAEAQELAMRLSLFAPATIPWALMEGCWPEADGEDLEEWRDEELVRLHLLNERKDGYGLHPLVREFLAMQLEAQRKEKAGEWRSAFAEALVTAAKPINYTMTLTEIAEVEKLIPHLKELASFDASQFPQATSSACFDLDYFYTAQGLYNSAEEWGKRSLAIREAQLGSDHPAIATSLNNLAGLYQEQGRYDQAEPLYQRSLDINEAQLGSDHPNTATSLNNLALLYKSQGRYEEAEPLYQRSFVIREAQLGPDHPDTATSLNNLALLYKSQGRYEEAEPLYQRSLAIREAQLGPDHPQTAGSLNNLAGLYKSQGRYEEAEPLYQRSLDISEAQLGPDHPDTAGSLNNLAVFYYGQDRLGDSEKQMARAVSIRLQALGQDHSYTQGSIQDLAAIITAAVDQGRTAELSDHPLTQSILQQLEQQNPEPS